MRTSYCIIACFIALFLCPFFGITTISPLQLFDNRQELMIFTDLRVSRVLFCFFAGGMLSLAGLLLQGLFANPLVSPHTLGISSIAAFGICASLALGFASSLSPWVGICSSLLGLCCLLYSYRAISHDLTRLVLTGVLVGMVASNGVVLIQIATDMAGLLHITRWLMGSIVSPSWQDVWIVSVVGIGISGMLLFFSADLDMLSIGHEFAATRGVCVKAVIRRSLILSSLLIGTVVSLCGPLAFVGLLEPYVARKIAGNSHVRLIPTSFVLGGTFLALCDTLGRSLYPPYEIPAGVMTSIVVAPCVVWVLSRRAGEM